MCVSISMSHTLHFLTLLLLILLLSSTCSVHGGREPPNPNNVYNVVPVDSLRPATTCSSSSVPGTKVVHRYGPCSPLLDNSPPPTSYQLFLKDQSRVDFINDRKSATNSVLGGGEYLVTVRFGTPRRKQTLILDTGSDLTWVQCNPCSVTSCYHQKQPIFDPSASSTYTSCHRPICDRSDYTILYADNSCSTGDLATDTLAIPGSGTIPNFIFGCGHNNTNGFGDAAGVLGLSKGGNLSIVSQTKSTFGGIFCYCLSPGQGLTGYLVFGRDALRKCPTETSTPLLARPNKPYYFVDLVGITIGTKRLPVSSFLSKTPNTIMDSGTVITRLPSSVYSALRAEFINLMSAYPAGSRHNLLDTCYNLTGHENAAVPKMVLHFKGADVALDSSGVIWWEEGSQMCLAFAATEKDDDLNIIGNNQQKTLGVLYHIPQNKLEFRTHAC